MKKIKSLLAKIGRCKQTEIAVKLIKFVKQKNPAVLYVEVRIISAAAGIIISFVSFIHLINIIKNLLKDKSYVGDELYLTAAILTLTICACMLTYGFKYLFSDIINIIRDGKSGPEKFEDYQEVEDALVQEKIPSSEARAKTIIEKDVSFIWKYLFFLGLIILLLIGKSFIPDEFFWNLRLTPGYFSFPMVFMGILSFAAALRLASIYFHRDEKRQNKVDEKIISIKGAEHPATFIPEIEKALLPLRENGKPNIIVHTGFNEMEGNGENSGNIEGKLFIETPTKPARCEPHPIGYFYLLLAFILYITGVLFLTKPPPDNISVLSVPTIAIGYLWAIVKGGILVFCGWALLESVSSIFRTGLLESVMVYVNIGGTSGRTIVKTGEGEANSVETGKIVLRNDCHFWVYTTKIVTEADTDTGKRHIIKRTVDKDSRKAERLVTDAIEKFKKEGERESKAENIKKILILSANPLETERLRLDEEVREIEEGLLRSKFRGQFEIQTRWAVRYRDLRRSLLDSKPQIVHFSGHGEEDCLVLEGELGIPASIAPKAISGLFELCSGHVECVMLNACYSVSQTAAINKHINYVIGMTGKINDKAAIEFSVGFYDALGAGRSVEDAFKFGCNALQEKFPNISDDLMPVLKKGNRG